ncbi:GSCFA domain-containing protein [Flammeovirga sp. MY04]|nr:GSCFA domain-containing protein [Flammeovirga sp. MY04]
MKMMQNETFRTPIQPQKFDKKIKYDSKIVSIGSCFSSNIGKILEDYRFNILSNPYGTLYNPISIHQNIVSAIREREINNDHILDDVPTVKSLDYHSDIEADNVNDLKTLIDSQNLKVKEQLSDAEFLFITWGSAFVFEYKKTNKVVGNCHKLPAKEFKQELLSAEEIVASFDELMHEITSKTQVVITVSPVRHFRNGLIDNSLSKATLRYASHIIESKYANVTYFPSYEIMIDELRDYRFYKDDMVHPTNQAILYIWDYLKETLLDDSTINTMEQWDKIVKGLNHRPINPESEAHQKFLKKMITWCEGIQKFNVDDVILRIEEQIVNPTSH